MGFSMIDATGHNPRPNAQTTPDAKVRDVADFHLRWREFRPVALGIGQHLRLSDLESDTLGWMIALLDRIGPLDLDDSQS